MKKIIFIILLIPVFCSAQKELALGDTALDRIHVGRLRIASLRDTNLTLTDTFPAIVDNRGNIKKSPYRFVRYETFLDSIAAISGGGVTPTLDQVTTAGNTTTNSITVANVSWKGGTGSTLGQNGVTSVGPESYGTLQLGSTANANQGIVYTDVLSGTRTYKLPNTSGTIALVETVKAMTKSKGVTLESPTSSENFGLWQTQVDITITSINAVVIGSSPSVTINIAFGSDITSLTNVFSSGTAITNTTTGQTINSGFNDATIPAGSWIRLKSTASSGTITQIEVTINYTED